MINFSTLKDTRLEILHKAFVEAFSDYQVKIDLPFWKFSEMLCRRGYTAGKSIGAFRDGELVGFILNGFREWNGRPTVYDLGTGVVPEYRKQGLTTSMFLNISGQLRKEGVRQYLLEVLQQNKSAFELYKKQGFQITRSFLCYKLDKADSKLKGSCEVEHVSRLEEGDWEQLKLFGDMQPSWQNSVESVKALADAFSYSIIKDGDRIIGYGMIDKRTGDIPQFGVAADYRSKGIGKSIIADLKNCTESERIAVLNVDSQSENVRGFLNALGFDNYVDQYEMLLEL